MMTPEQSRNLESVLDLASTYGRRFDRAGAIGLIEKLIHGYSEDVINAVIPMYLKSQEFFNIKVFCEMADNYSQNQPCKETNARRMSPAQFQKWKERNERNDMALTEEQYRVWKEKNAKEEIRRS